MIKKNKTVKKYSLKPAAREIERKFRLKKSYLAVIPLLLLIPLFIYKDNITGCDTKSGHEYLKENDYKNAVKAYTREIKDRPDDPIGYYNRGTVYLNWSKYDESIQDLTRAIELNPSSVHFYTNRANAYFRKGDFENAVKDNTKAIELSPDKAISYYNRGRAYYHSGRKKEALADFEKAYSMGALQAKGLIEEIKREKIK